MPRRKILGCVHGIGININNILGSGIVTAPGIIWKAIKSPWIVLLLWLAGGIVSMAGSLTYVELGAMHKVNGGEAKYLFYAFPKPEFMMSYIFSFMYIFAIRPCLINAVLQSAAQYFWYAVKGYRYNEHIEQDKNGWNLPFSPFWVIKLTAVAFLFIITVYHMFNNKWVNYINQAITVIKLTTYSIIIIAGIYRLIENWPISQINWKNSLSGSTDITAYPSSILLIIFSYDGWNSLNFSLDEFQKPEKNLIFSNSISVGIITLIYLLLNVALISVVPGESVTQIDDETIVATFFRQLFDGSEIAVRIFTGLIVISVVGTAISQVWSGSRIIVAVAELKFFPIYSRKLRTWNDHFDTPINALIVQFIWCSLIIIFIGSITINSFTIFSTFAMYSYWIFYSATGISLLVIRYKNKKKGRNDIENYSDPNATETIELEDHSNSNVPTEIIEPSHNFKVPSPIVGTFILSGLFILTFSFADSRVQHLTPIFISYGLLFIATVLWKLWHCAYIIETETVLY